VVGRDVKFDEGAWSLEYWEPPAMVEDREKLVVPKVDQKEREK
jgi:hypothetical protein